jgi:hypothetical protein
VQCAGVAGDADEFAFAHAVQRMLGHASAVMTLDRYADLFDDDLDAVADRLDEARTRFVYPMCTEASVTDLDAARREAAPQ